MPDLVEITKGEYEDHLKEYIDFYVSELHELREEKKRNISKLKIYKKNLIEDGKYKYYYRISPGEYFKEKV